MKRKRRCSGCGVELTPDEGKLCYDCSVDIQNITKLPKEVINNRDNLFIERREE